MTNANRIASSSPRRVVLATFGSLGDLHPFVALAKGLQSRGHEPIIATSEYHRELLERHRIG
ncbi:MAG TPA: glycosyltransferase, partial [Pirellulales bacterium]|nr:glycosyltransferase [Pirellulales bacterium]